MDENTIMMIIWLSIFVVALISEFVTDALVSIWFCAGALVALAVTYIPGMPWWGEIIVFVSITILTLILLRPIMNRLLLRKMSKTNIDTMIGKKGKITKEITALDYGTVRINGVTWTAMSADPANPQIALGSVVEVVSIEGNKLFVRQIQL